MNSENQKTKTEKSITIVLATTINNVSFGILT